MGSLYIGLAPNRWASGEFGGRVNTSDHHVLTPFLSFFSVDHCCLVGPVNARFFNDLLYSSVVLLLWLIDVNQTCPTDAVHLLDTVDVRRP